MHRQAIVLALCLGSAASFSLSPSILAGKELLSTRCRSASLPMQLRMTESSIVARRSALMTFAGLALGSVSGLRATPAAADDQIEIYVGAGCFWHVQHEVTEAERKILGRSPSDYTAVVGYAGGNKVGKDGKVCYHNLLMDSDYGRLGHSEAVVLKTPANKVPEIATLLIDRLFVKGRRADPQDRGGEYRSVLGLPGGISSPLLASFETAAQKKGMKLLEGKGDEPDTLADKSIFVYDTAKYPFYPGEVYHQYHDDMVEKYGSEYGALRTAGVKRGAFKPTGCPEIGF